MPNVWAVAQIEVDRLTPTRIHVQTSPLDRPWHGWERRTGTVPPEMIRRVNDPGADAVDMEQVHQDIWQAIAPPRRRRRRR